MTELSDKELGPDDGAAPRELVNHMDNFTGTAADLVDWVMQRGLTMSEVNITACHLKYQTEATDAEIEQRAKWHADTVRRQEEWEIGAYERLKAKFDPAPSPVPLEGN